MPTIVPIRDLRNTSEISKLVHAKQEPIFITKNGRPIAKLVSPYQDKLNLVDELFSSLPSDWNLEEARKERMNQI